MTIQEIRETINGSELYGAPRYMLTVNFVKVGDEHRFFNTTLDHTAAIKPEELPLVDGCGAVNVYADSFRFAGTHSRSMLIALKAAKLDWNKTYVTDATLAFFEATFGKRVAITDKSDPAEILRSERMKPVEAAAA